MLHLLHRIQDIQVCCFAVVFGVMAMQNRTNRTVLLIWYSFLLAAGVAALEMLSAHLPAAISVGVLHAILSFRYLYLNHALVHFNRRAAYTNWISLGLSCVPVLLIPVWIGHHGMVPAMACVQTAIGLQVSLLAFAALRSTERETYAARMLLATFFGVVAFMRFSTAASLLLHNALAARLAPGATFMTVSTAGYVLPFALLWMMNARVHRELLQQSMVDPLTELLNRRGLHHTVIRELARYHRDRQDFSVVVLDLDHFKHLNDTFGHAGGDQVLSEFASLLRHELRDSDVLARTGGEEFVLLAPMTSAAACIAMIDRIRQRLAVHEFHVGHRVAQVSASFGITDSGGRRNLSWAGLLHEADLALYAAKNSGRNCAVLYRRDMEDNLSIPADRRELCSALIGTGQEALAADVQS